MMECLECGSLYEAQRPWQKFCGSKCRNSNHRKSDKCKTRVKEYSGEYKKTPVSRYNAQKQTAKRRGIEFNLNFNDWWEMWEPYWNKRGNLPQEFCMARNGDYGPYEKGNVSIITNSENCAYSAKVSNVRDRDLNNGRFISENS